MSVQAAALPLWFLDEVSIQGTTGSRINARASLVTTGAERKRSASAPGRSCARTNRELAGGLWSLFAVQSPGAPRLSIRPVNSSTVTIFWPSPSSEFVLQQQTNLTTTNWTDVAITPGDDGTNKTVTVSPIPGNQFCRLRKP
jgi:hypothetical protein